MKDLRGGGGGGESGENCDFSTGAAAGGAIVICERRSRKRDARSQDDRAGSKGGWGESISRS